MNFQIFLNRQTLIWRLEVSNVLFTSSVTWPSGGSEAVTGGGGAWSLTSCCARTQLHILNIICVSESTTTWTWRLWTSWGKGATSSSMLRTWRESDSVTWTVSTPDHMLRSDWTERRPISCYWPWKQIKYQLVVQSCTCFGELRCEVDKSCRTSALMDLELFSSYDYIFFSCRRPLVADRRCLTSL